MPRFPFLLLLALLSGCTTLIRPVSPASVESIPVTALAESQILVPVTVRREALVAMANQSLPPVLDGTGGGSVKTVVGKLDYDYDYRFARSALTVTVEGTSFTIGTTLAGTVTARTLGVGATVNAKLAVNISGTLSMRSSWKLAPELTGRLVVDSAEIPFGLDVLGTRVGFSVNIRDDLESLLQGPFADLLASVRAQVASYDVKPQVLPLWNSLRSPVRLSANPPTWLTLVPDGVFFAPRGGSDGDLHFLVGLRAKTGIAFGTRPEDVDLGELPPLAQAMGTSGFRLRVPVRIPFEELSRMASEEVAGKTFDVEGGQVTLQSLAVFGSGRRIAVRSDFSAQHPVLGDFRGTLYFVGVPRFDAVNQRFLVEDFDFDAQTSHALVVSAGWLLHGQLARQGAAALNRAFADLGDAPLRSLLEQINLGLARVEFRGMVAEGRLDEIRILGLGHDFKNFVVEAELSGDLVLSVNQL